MRDSFGREVDYLRLSLTESCNLCCAYCRDVCPGRTFEQMPVDRAVEIASAAAELGIRKVRLTGGEPCVRKDLSQIVRGIAAVPGIDEVCLTTNGTLIASMAEELHAAGLSRVNISIDSLAPERYAAITRGGLLANALAGLAAVKAAGFERTKVNCVLIEGFNDDEIKAFETFAVEQNVEVRFIELMPIGPARNLRMGTVPAKGAVAPLTKPFCSSCNRIRVTADEHAKPCLHSAEELPLKGLHGDALVDALRAAILAKPAGHNLASGSSQSLRSMSRIGG